MKKLVLLLVMFLPFCLFAQKIEKIEKKTFEEVTFNKGTNIKYRDFFLNKLEVAKKEVELRGTIRVYKVDNAISYFYLIKNEGGFPGVKYIGIKERAEPFFMGFFNEQEINIIINETTKMLSEVNDDLALNPEYLDNKLVTDSRQEVGYVIKEGKVEWYLTLSENAGRSLRMENGNSILNSFTQALNLIEKLKQQSKLL